MSRLRAAIRAHRDERGQMAITMVLTLLVVFLFFALAFDAGLWYFDHRTAQNQAEAAALAGVQELPADDWSVAAQTAKDWLARNGATTVSSCDLPGDNTIPNTVMEVHEGMVFWLDTRDDKYKAIRVCVGRESPGVFAALSGIDFVDISGGATARVGPVTVANVMPWAVVPPDPDCEPDQTCEYDANGDGDFDDPGECQADFQVCPWGLNLDNLIAFKDGGGGNTGIIDACGQGASSYTDCIEGELISGFFEEGETVVVGLQGGNLGQNTDSALTARYPDGDPSWADCDVESTPQWETGYDPDGKADGLERWETNPVPGCEERLVLIPILYSMPPQGGGSESLTVLGVATFGIAKWNREGSSKSAWGTETGPCANHQGGQPPEEHFECGMVWGYLYKDLRPPDFLLQQIGDSQNPFAPLLIALID